MVVKNLFHDITSKFREDILSGKLSFGEKLPPEAELAEEFNVSRPTIAKIYNALQIEGLVKKKPGYGTTVTYMTDKKHFCFGLLLPGSGESEIFGILNDHFLEFSKQNDYSCLWDGTIANNAEIRQNLILKNCQRYIDQKVDGVLFSPLERTTRANYLNDKVCKMLDSVGIPVVLIDRDITAFPNRSKYDVIGIDNYNAGYVMAELLIKAGCQYINFFLRKDSAYSVNLRMAGCFSACYNYGLSFIPENTFIGEPSDINIVRKIKVFSGKTGLLCANDSTAAVLMSTLHKLGIKVGEDILMAGFDDMKYAKHLQVPLSTYKQPLLDIARTCINAMKGKLLNPLHASCTYNLQGKIIIRESTRFIKKTN